MPLYSRRDNRILFIHIPKTAGSSITSAFRKACYVVQYLNEPARTGTRDKKPCNPQHYHAELIKEKILPECKWFDFTYQFAITREPLQRLFSEFDWRLPHHKSQNKNKYYTQFEQWALHMLEERKHNPYVGDNHMRPQSEFIMPDVDVFDISELALLQAHLNKYGIHNIPRVNVTAKQPRPQTYQASNKFIDAFYDAYLVDYEQLGYTKPF